MSDECLLGPQDSDGKAVSQRRGRPGYAMPLA